MKKVLITIVVVVVIACVGLFLGAKVIVANALEKAIGAPVSIGSFTVTPSHVGIYNLKVGNLSGFKEKYLAHVPEIYISYDLASVLKNEAHIKEIRLNVDQITVERNTTNVNLMQLGAVKNMMQKSGRQPVSKPTTKIEKKIEKKSAKPMHVKIDLVNLSLGRVKYVDSTGAEPTIREFNLGINKKELRNITDPKQITMQIVTTTLQRVGLNALMFDFNQFGAGMGVQMETFKKGINEFLGKVKVPLNQEPQKAPVVNTVPVTSSPAAAPATTPAVTAAEPQSEQKP